MPINCLYLGQPFTIWAKRLKLQSYITKISSNRIFRDFGRWLLDHFHHISTSKRCLSITTFHPRHLQYVSDFSAYQSSDRLPCILHNYSGNSGATAIFKTFNHSNRPTETATSNELSLHKIGSCYTCLNNKFSIPKEAWMFRCDG